MRYWVISTCIFTGWCNNATWHECQLCDPDFFHFHDDNNVFLEKLAEKLNPLEKNVILSMVQSSK